MNNKRKDEIFSAGCGCCEETIKLVKSVGCPSCDITVLDMQERHVAERAKSLVLSVPAVVIDGKLAACCAGRGPEEGALRAAGLGVPL
jgi:glutaredoxin 3